MKIIFITVFLVTITSTASYSLINSQEKGKEATNSERQGQKKNSARVLKVVAIGPGNECQKVALSEAIEFWNLQFAELKLQVQLSEPQFKDIPVPALSNIFVEGKSGEQMRASIPPALWDESGDIIAVLTDQDLISFAIPIQEKAKSKGMVVIRNCAQPPLTLPNVARNLLAHELGHALGLSHNADPTTLMCGRPAPCRPAVYRADTKKMFPLIESDRAALKRRWK